MKNIDMQSSDALGLEIIKALGLPQNPTAMTLRFEAGKPLQISAEFLITVHNSLDGARMKSVISRYELVQGGV